MSTFGAGSTLPSQLDSQSPFELTGRWVPLSSLEERSAGALLFNETSAGRRYLLLKYPAGHWDFPKGAVEKGETPEQTMVREVQEETGLVNVVPVAGFRKVIEYYYKRDSRTVHKEVTFFLAQSREDKVVLSFEHRDYAWLSYEEALKVVSYSNSIRLLRAAEDLLSGPSSTR